jgi:Protein of Unknown function (DUF2784)
MRRGLVGVVAAAHFAFVAYVVGGGFLAWRWPRSLVAHLAAVGWAVAGLSRPVPCPLTALENDLRRRAGQPALLTGFMDHYVDGVFYPRGAASAVRAAAMTAVGASWAGLAVRQVGRRRARRPAAVVSRDER